MVGETLGTLSTEGTPWLRATEELFFREPAAVLDHAASRARPARSAGDPAQRLLADVRPRPAAPGCRRAARGGGARQDWRPHVGLGVNTDFRATWSELLRQVWLGLENSANSSGANPPTPRTSRCSASQLKDMLNNRRQGGLLAREEFVLRHGAQLVPPHAADRHPDRDRPQGRPPPAPRTGLPGSPSGWGWRRRPGPASCSTSPSRCPACCGRSSSARSTTRPPRPLCSTPAPRSASDMRNVINQWQSATGERVKERPTGTVPVSAQPLRAPSPMPTPAPVASPARVPTAAFQPVPSRCRNVERHVPVRSR